MEYVITEKTEVYGWCLHCLAGKDYDGAIQVLAREQKAHPEKELRIDAVDSKDCWWNDTTE